MDITFKSKTISATVGNVRQQSEQPQPVRRAFAAFVNAQSHTAHTQDYQYAAASNALT